MTLPTLSGALLASVGLATVASAQDECTVRSTGQAGTTASATAPPAPTSPPQSAAAAGGGSTLIYTNIVGAAASAVPGLPGVSFKPGSSLLNFDRVFGSPNGNWILTALVDLPTSEDEVLLVNGVIVQREGQSAPWAGGVDTSGPFDTRVGVNDSGDFTFATATSAPADNDYIVTNIGGTWGFSARESDPIPGLPGNFYDDTLDTPVILADGTSGFAADLIDGTVATTEDDILVLGSTILMQEGVTVPPGQNAGGTEFIENFDLNDFWVTPDGAHWLVQGDLTGATATDQVLVYDGAVVLQEGFVIPGSTFTDPIDSLGIVGCFMDSGGNWYARGNNDVSETDWVLKNGSVIATLGQPIFMGSTELWDDASFGDCYFLHVANSNGDYVIGGVTDSADQNANAVLVYNATTEVCREGDPIDVDGNGLFDDDAFINTFGNDDAYLSDAGLLYLVVTLRDGAGTLLGQAFLSVDVGGTLGSNYCTANANSTGVVGSISAVGSTLLAINDVTLVASNLPPSQFGIFVTSRTQDFVPNVGSGNLCLGGTIGRYQMPGQILQVDANGEFALAIDTTLMPQGAVQVAIAPGETWNFQAWHRDFTTTVPVTNTSNLTDGLAITFN